MDLKNAFKSSNIIVIIILLITIILYYNTLFCDFTNWDDEINVCDNAAIKALDFTNLKTIFTTSFVGMYVPFTMLSYMADYAVAGLHPGMFHLTNLLLHLVNVFLVFIIVKKLFPESWIAGITALLFAIHPLNVEAVTWISTRSNLLYSAFWLLSLWCYIRYLNESSTTTKRYYFYSLLFFLAAIFSKSQAITLPLVLILIDYWLNRKSCKKSIVEKIPFFVLALIFGFVTIYFRENSGHLNPTEIFSVNDKILFSFYSIMMYIWKLILPLHLSAFYPTPDSANGYLPLPYYMAPFVILLIFLIIFKIRKNMRIIVFGFLFFLLTISIVSLKIISFGHQIIAERYMYLPGIGIFLILAYALNHIFLKKNTKSIYLVKHSILGFFLIFLLFLSYTTFHRNQIWKNSITLYSDVIEKYPEIALPYYNRGLAKVKNGDIMSGISDFDSAIRSRHYKTGEVNRFYISRANGKKIIGKIDEAMADYNKAIELNPLYADAYFNRGNLKVNCNDFLGAKADYLKAVQLFAGSFAALTQLGVLATKNNQTSEALQYFGKALLLNPDYATAYYNRGLLWNMQGNYKAAIFDFSKVIELSNNDAFAWYNRGYAYAGAMNKNAACADFYKSLELGYTDAKKAIGQWCQ